LAEKSPYRPCGCGLVEFFKSTAWPFLVNLTGHNLTLGIAVIRDQNQAMGL
jgi:hypothetical protein